MTPGLPSKHPSLFNMEKCLIVAVADNWGIGIKNQLPWQKFINAPMMWLGRQIKRSFFAKKGLLDAYNEGIREGKEFIKTSDAIANKVNFTPKMMSRSFEIQWEMIVGTLRRVFNF